MLLDFLLDSCKDSLKKVLTNNVISITVSQVTNVDEVVLDSRQVTRIITLKSMLILQLPPITHTYIHTVNSNFSC